MRITTICRGFLAFSLLFLGHVHNTFAFTNYEGCIVSSDVEFFDLTAYQVEPYVPSVDEDGNTYLQGPALANAETNHYRDQYSDADAVKLTMDRYASLTANSVNAFKNFESKIIIVDPECNELKLFYGNLIGNSVVSFQTYLKMYEAAERLEHEILQDFVEQRVKLRPKSTNDIINLLKSDLAYDPVLTKATLSEQFLRDLNIGKDGNHRIGGELALLAFAKKGGVIRAEETNLQAFIISPKSLRGIQQNDKSVLLLSNGVAHVISDFDTRLAKYALGQLGVTTNELFVSQVHDGNDLVCRLDEVNHWYTKENGSVRRECNFTQLVIKSITTNGWKSTFDEASNPISYAQINDIYAKHGQIMIVH